MAQLELSKSGVDNLVKQILIGNEIVASFRE